MKYIIAVIFALSNALAFADGVSCSEMAGIIADLEQKKANVSGSKAQNIRGLLAASYKSYYASGCSEAELATYAANGIRFKSKEEVK